MHLSACHYPESYLQVLPYGFSRDLNIMLAHARNRREEADELTLLDDVVERLAGVLVGRHCEDWPVGSFKGSLHTYSLKKDWMCETQKRA
jgi:hypothetical protein